MNPGRRSGLEIFLASDDDPAVCPGEPAGFKVCIIIGVSHEYLENYG